MPCNMRLDISAGATSMKRRKEKQLPLSSPEAVKREYRMKHKKKKRIHENNKQEKNKLDKRATKPEG